MIEAVDFTPITFVDNEDFPVSFDSDNKPYSNYSDEKWYFPSDDCVISFFRLDGRFEQTAKKLALKIINTRNFRSTKLFSKNIMTGAVIFQSLIRMSGGNDYSDLDDNWIYNLVISHAKHEGLKYKTWKNNFIFISYLKREVTFPRN